MPKIEINLLKLQTGNTDDTSVHRPARAQLPRAFFMIASVLMVFLAATSVFSYSQSKYDNSALNSALQSLFSLDVPFFGENGDKKLSGEEEDRINILLLGIGGKEHEGPDLSDTVMIASLQPSTNRVALFSIPRDLLVSMEGYGYRKINHANAFGESQSPGHGAEYTQNVLQSTFGIPIHYYVRVDFAGFSEMIDIVGGVTVMVDNAFTDYTYPAGPNKHQVVSFTAGEQTMDGATALQFVRSRHSVMNNEGTDFARSKRQQKILAALKQKLLSPQFLANPGKISQTLQVLDEHLSTNLSGWELFRLARVSRDIQSGDISNTVFDDGPTGYLVSSTAEGAYVLQPRNGSFEEIQEKIHSIFSEVSSALHSPTARAIPPAPKKQTSFSLSIQNGTGVEGLAGRIADSLKKNGYSIESIKNAAEKTRTQTVIYNIGGIQADLLSPLATAFSAPILEVSRESLSDTSNADVIVLLGADTQILTSQ